MKAILINAYTRKISEVEVEAGDNELDSIYGHIECQYIETGMHLENGDVVFVDEEGMLKECNHFFYMLGAHQPFAGSGLIMGTKAGGDSADCNIDIDEVKSRVKFLSLNQAINFNQYQS